MTFWSKSYITALLPLCSVSYKRYSFHRVSAGPRSRPSQGVAVTKVITFQAIPVLIDGHDTQGQLVLADGELVAVLARLDGETHDPKLKGLWHLEAGFGRCDEGRTLVVFETLDEAAAWAQSRLDNVHLLRRANG